MADVNLCFGCLPKDGLKSSIIFNSTRPALGCAQLVVGSARPALGYTQPKLGYAQPGLECARPALECDHPRSYLTNTDIKNSQL